MTLISVEDLLGSTVTPFTITKSDGSEMTLYQKDLPAGAVLDFVETEEGSERNGALLVLVTQAVCQEDGTPVFTPEDEDRLRDMPVRIFEQISTAVVAAAGLGGDEEEGEEPKNS